MADVSLRPLSLRPGGAAGANPFASFGKGAGLGLKNRTYTAKDEKKKPAGEVLRYSRDYLMKFAEAYNRLPSELQHSNLEIFLDADDPEREAQKQLLQKVAAAGDDADERDWRSRQALPTLPADGQQRQQQPADGQQRQPAAAGRGAGAEQGGGGAAAGGGDESNLPRLQRAAETGKSAWVAGTASEGTEQTLRKVKGILNKLTPEKFDRLLSQLIPLVHSYEVLQGTITQVFENAVQQPTFVAMYADLCNELDQALPEFTAPGEERSVSFKKMLANTCQQEYEATEQARERVRSSPAEEREDAERRVKQRMLGNIRLISELFKKVMVNDRIMLLIMQDLLGAADSEPSEDNIEAVCEMLSTAGASLEKNSKSKPRLDAAFAKLGKLAGSKTYPSRIRFVIRDVLDLRAQHWVARREVFTAKKLDEIRSEAQAELGIVDVSIPGMDALPAMAGLAALQPQKAAEVELFPAFKSSDAGWAAARTNRPGSAGGGGGGGKYSAFLGEYVPLEDTNATPPQAPGQAPRAPRKDLSDEQRESLGKSLFSDYLSSPSVDEAVATAQELDVGGFMPKLVQIGLEKAFDTPDTKQQLAVADLLAALAARGVLSADDLREGCGPLLEALEDISLDTPSAPRLLGRLLGSAAASGMLGLDFVVKTAQGVESAEPRRNFVAAALLAVKESGGEEKLVSLAKEGGFSADLLKHEAEFDGEMPEPAEFLKDQGLEAVASL
ncbi:hypothetical protein N2152v2_008758 [Parachlorella kessleri]